MLQRKSFFGVKYFAILGKTIEITFVTSGFNSICCLICLEPSTLIEAYSYVSNRTTGMYIKVK